ncbi:MAG: hypothetical protein AVDCRST_MAG18-4382 [uncultured Thermomicrobiales bacterium]|uniref:Integral membrane protein n=1 Tax=uncultured Thermomicrobiales bacterium TaxID=1645740 RepID=A0A6J4VXI7_9BACT|nr:MAG: hypothetical protein AVDCRST_MAG18-4382 [uncultured Thermomicrobiales bacterium]
MTTGAAPAKSPPVILLGLLSILEGLTFLVGGALHLGLRLPLGFTTLAEPMIIPAAIVEGLAGVGLLLAAGTVGVGAGSAWSATLGAHLFATGSVLLGMAALAAGAGTRTPLNDTYHRTILAILVVVVIVLLTPSARAAFGQGERGPLS